MRFVKPPLIRRQSGTQLRLGLRNLFILPTRFGLLWLAAAGLLQLVAIQMRSNGTLLLSFLLLGLMLLAMHLTHDALSGLEMRCGEPSPGFAGQFLAYPLLMTSRLPRQHLQLSFSAAQLHEIAELPTGDHQLEVLWRPSHRGLQRPGPLHIQTTSPLGLFVCWSRWEPDTPQLIYPARVQGPVEFNCPEQGQAGAQEWQDLKPYRPGERLTLVHWGSLAKGRPLQLKQFSDPASQHLMLKPVSGVPWERALEHLADRIWQLHHQGESYGLQLPGLTIEPRRGATHRDACLAGLAVA